MPLTEFQRTRLAGLSTRPADERYLAGDRLALAEPFDLTAGRSASRVALADADAFVRGRPADDCGCLYYSTREERFVVPAGEESLADPAIVRHFGRPGGVLPRIADARILDADAFRADMDPALHRDADRS